MLKGEEGKCVLSLLNWGSSDWSDMEKLLELTLGFCHDVLAGSA